MRWRRDGMSPPRCAARSASTDSTQEGTNMPRSMTVKSVSGLVTVALVAVGCATSTTGAMSGGSGHAAAMSMAAMATAPTSATPASTLRTTLNALLGEHLILAAAATGAALDGRGAEFK